MIEKYLYRINGLVIESELEMPELLSVNRRDVSEIHGEIVYGKHKEDVYKSIREGTEEYGEHDFIWINRQDVGTYAIHSGNKIVIDIKKDAKEYKVRNNMLCSVMAMLLFQRGIVAMHGATIVKNNKAILIVGYSKAGKSTLSNGLRMKGYKLLSDDLSAVYERSNDKFIVEPAFPRQSLNENIIESMGYEPLKYENVVRSRALYGFPIYDDFEYEGKEVGAIIELVSSKKEGYIAEEVSGAKKIETVIKHIYSGSMPQSIGLPSNYFKQCLKLATKTPIYRFKRNFEQMDVEEQIEIIENLINK